MSSGFVGGQVSYGLCGAEIDLEVCSFEDVCDVCGFSAYVCEIGPFNIGPTVRTYILLQAYCIFSSNISF